MSNHPHSTPQHRAALGELVFQDPAARRRLNQAMHLPVLVSLIWQVSTHHRTIHYHTRTITPSSAQLTLHWLRWHRIVVIDMPLLFETRADRYMSTTVVVSVPDDVQIARLMARDGATRAQAQARIDAQMPLRDKVSRAAVVIDNSSTREATQQQVDSLVHTLRGG